MQGDIYPKTAENLAVAPDSHGVYELWENSAVIYIGRAAGQGVTIRSRLNDHARGDDGPCTKVYTHYKREVTEAAVSREKQLLEEYQQTHGGRLPRCNERTG